MSVSVSLCSCHLFVAINGSDTLSVLAFTSLASHTRPFLGTKSVLTNDNVNIHTEGGDVLFNDALSTFYLRLYGVGNIHTYMHTNIHTYIHACMHACITYIHI